MLPLRGLIIDPRPIAACLRRGRPGRSWQNPNSRYLFTALDVLDAALLSSKVGVSRLYDSGRGFRERHVFHRVCRRLGHVSDIMEHPS